MAEEKKKQEELDDEQLDEIAGGGVYNGWSDQPRLPEPREHT